MKTRVNKKIKDILVLQLVIVIYTFSGIMAKLASGNEFLSFDFMKWYFIEFLILVIYAVLWQQILKKFDLSKAYTNKATAVIWSMIWAVLIFNEHITVNNIIGCIVIISGIVMVNCHE